MEQLQLHQQQQQQQQQPQPQRPLPKAAPGAPRPVPYKVFFQTFKTKKYELAVAGIALCTLAISTGRMSLKSERKRLDAEYGEMIEDMEAQNTSLRNKIATVKDRVLSELSKKDSKLSPLPKRMNVIFDEHIPAPIERKMESTPGQPKPAAKFFV